MELSAGERFGLSSLSAVGGCAWTCLREPELEHLSGGGMGSGWLCLLFQGRRGRKDSDFRPSVRPLCHFSLGLCRLRVGRRSDATSSDSLSPDSVFSPRASQDRERCEQADPLDENTGTVTASLNASSPSRLSSCECGGGLQPAHLTQPCGLLHGGGIGCQRFSGRSRQLDEAALALGDTSWLRGTAGRICHLKGGLG